MLFFFFVVFLLFQFNSSIPHHIHRHKRSELNMANTFINHDQPLNPTIKGVDNTFACSGDYCFKITEFRISENFSISCFRDDILILFEVNEKNQTKLFGYLTHKMGRGNKILETKSESSPICQMIKK